LEWVTRWADETSEFTAVNNGQTGDSEKRGKEAAEYLAKMLLEVPERV